jgi:hypothetical protein
MEYFLMRYVAQGLEVALARQIGGARRRPLTGGHQV